MTPLHWAADHGSLACAEVLLKADAHVNAKVGRKRLYFCCYHGPVFRLLANPFSLLFPQDHDGQTPLHYGRFLLTTIVLSRGSGFRFALPFVHRRTQNPVLSLPAAMCGHESVVRLLCQHGADVNAADNDGETPLQAAASDAIKTAMTA